MVAGAGNSALIYTQKERPAVIDYTDAKPIKPTGAVQEISAERFLLRKEYGRRKLDAKRFDCDVVLIGGKRSRNGSKTLKPAGFDFQPEEAICGIGIQFRYKLHGLSFRLKAQLGR